MPYNRASPAYPIPFYQNDKKTKYPVDMRVVWIQTREGLQAGDSRGVKVCQFVEIEDKVFTN